MRALPRLPASPTRSSDSGVFPCVPRNPDAATLAAMLGSSHGANDGQPTPVAEGGPAAYSRTPTTGARRVIRVLPRGQLFFPFDPRMTRAALFDAILTERAGGQRESAWSNAAVARRLGVSEAAVRSWRCGERPIADAAVGALGLGAEWNGGVGR